MTPRRFLIVFRYPLSNSWHTRQRDEMTRLLYLYDIWKSDRFRLLFCFALIPVYVMFCVSTVISKGGVICMIGCRVAYDTVEILYHIGEVTWTTGRSCDNSNPTAGHTSKASPMLGCTLATGCPARERSLGEAQSNFIVYRRHR